ncbi:pEARLI lipid transfer protein 3 [Spatholobus suberectus]|nr:pEARLI lipid transfer protein 3 [Spatholobus suberectus]
MLCHQYMHVIRALRHVTPNGRRITEEAGQKGPLLCRDHNQPSFGTPAGGDNPPPTLPYPPPHGGVPPPQRTCPIDALKLGLCLDVLGGLVHVGIGNPIENVCCPVIQGLLDLEAAIVLQRYGQALTQIFIS